VDEEHARLRLVREEALADQELALAADEAARIAFGEAVAKGRLRCSRPWSDP
jgi:hypothetical protein